MSMDKLHSRVPNNLRDAVERYQNENGIENTSEATRQLIEAGVRAQAESGPGERLAERATAIAAVGSIVALAAAGFGATWAWTMLIPFLTTTLVFALVLASIRVMAGKDLA